MSYPKFIDVASYQPDTLVYFQAAKKLGIKAVIVKLTEGGTGTKYVNPKATNQIRNAKAAGLIVHAYHFLRATSNDDARGECRYFVQQAKARGIGASSIMAIDVESGNLTRNKAALTNYINSFTDELHKQGYPNIAIYSNTSWFNARIDRSKTIARSFWCAAYGVNQPGIDNAAAWQYSSDMMIAGARTDVSYDFTGFYTGGAKGTASKPQHKHTTAVKLPRGVKRESGVFTANTTLRVWNKPGMSYTGVNYYRGESVRYQGYVRNGNYIYVAYQSRSGAWHYVAVRENGIALGTFK